MGVRALAAALARSTGLVSSQVELIERAAALHDIGKVAVPAQILLRQGPLTDEEFRVVKLHTTVGAPGKAQVANACCRSSS